MFKLAIIFGLLAGVQLLPVDEPANDVDFRIAGGAPITIDRVPWQLSLRSRASPPNTSRHICGGSLITPNRALTARRCFPSNSQPGDFIVVAGTSNLQEASVFQTPLERFIFQRNPGGSIHIQIAVLWLLNAAPIGPTIRPITLPPQDAMVPSGIQALITGWGATTENPSSPITNNLKYTLLPILTHAQCSAIYVNQFTENMLCAGGIGGRAACRGDFGGALVANGYQVAVATWGYCGRANRPNIFARVGPAVNWIRSVI